MDRAKSKKIRNIRVIATNIFMSISVVAIVFVLMLIAMGFTFNESGGLEQAGLVQIVSNPSGANVEINGANQVSHTDFSKMLSAGEHTIRVSKSGYDTWTKKLKIDAGLLTRVEWVRLFPKQSDKQDVLEFDTLRLATFSPDRKHLLALEENGDAFHFIDIQDDKPQSKDLPLSECFGTKSKTIHNGAISILSWNNDNTKIIAKWTNNDNTSWYLINLNHPDQSINLTQKYNLVFDSILIANDAANKLWALENGNLRLIDANSSTISSTIASDIKKIANNKSTVSFINTETTEDDDKKSTHYNLNVYKEGEQSYTQLAALDNVDENTTIRLAMGTYWSDEWLAYSIDRKFSIISGKYPSYEKDKADSLKERYSSELESIPQFASVNANHRIIVLAGEKNIFSFDIETNEQFNYSFANSLTGIAWLDDYLLWQNVDNNIIARDFDGENRRNIIKSVDNQLPVTISENDKYLYYFNIVEAESTAEASKSPSDADLSTNTAATLKYILKRQALKY